MRRHPQTSVFQMTLLIGLSTASLADAAPTAGATETVSQAVCRLIETSARARSLPIPFLTRVIWQESSFRASAISRAGAQGIAQFMPGTAQERGLANPFD